MSIDVVSGRHELLFVVALRARLRKLAAVRVGVALGTRTRRPVKLPRAFHVLVAFPALRLLMCTTEGEIRVTLAREQGRLEVRLIVAACTGGVELPVVHVCVTARTIVAFACRHLEPILVVRACLVAVLAGNFRVRSGEHKTCRCVLRRTEPMRRGSPLRIVGTMTRRTIVGLSELMWCFVAVPAALALNFPESGTIRLNVASGALGGPVLSLQSKKLVVTKAGCRGEVSLVVTASAIHQRLASVNVLVAGSTLLVKAEESVGHAMTRRTRKIFVPVVQPELHMLVLKRGSPFRTPCDCIDQIKA